MPRSLPIDRKHSKIDFGLTNCWQLEGLVDASLVLAMCGVEIVLDAVVRAAR